VWLDARGSVLSAAVESSWDSRLNAPALELARASTYRSALLACVPIPGTVQVRVRFPPDVSYRNSATAFRDGSTDDPLAYVSVREARRVAFRPPVRVRALVSGAGANAAAAKRAADDAVQRLVDALVDVGVAREAIGRAPLSFQTRRVGVADTCVVVVALSSRQIAAALHVLATAADISYSVGESNVDRDGDRTVLRMALARSQREAAAYATAQGMRLGRLRTIDVTPVQVAWHGGDAWDVVSVTARYDLHVDDWRAPDVGSAEFTTYGRASREQRADAFRFQLVLIGRGADDAAALVAAHASFDALATTLATLGVPRSALVVTGTDQNISWAGPQAAAGLSVTVTLDARVDPVAAMSLAAANASDAYVADGQLGVLTYGAQREEMLAEARRQAIARAMVLADVGHFGVLRLTRVQVLTDPPQGQLTSGLWHLPLVPGNETSEPAHVEFDVAVAATFQRVSDRTSAPVPAARVPRKPPTSPAAPQSKE
jgi:uncharacterized protein YggE